MVLRKKRAEKAKEEERINKPSIEDKQIHPTKEEAVGRPPTKVLPKPEYVENAKKRTN